MLPFLPIIVVQWKTTVGDSPFSTEPWLWEKSGTCKLTRFQLSHSSFKLDLSLFFSPKLGSSRCPVPKKKRTKPTHTQHFTKPQKRIFLRSTPDPVTATNEGLQGFPTKNGIIQVVTVTGWLSLEFLDQFHHFAWCTKHPTPFNSKIAWSSESKWKKVTVTGWGVVSKYFIICCLLFSPPQLGGSSHLGRSN